MGHISTAWNCREGNLDYSLGNEQDLSWSCEFWGGEPILKRKGIEKRTSSKEGSVQPTYGTTRWGQIWTKGDRPYR